MTTTRRDALKAMALASTAALLPSSASSQSSTLGNVRQRRGNINHSVSRWTYGHLSLDELCQLVISLGFNAIDLAGPNDWPTLKKYGINSSMCNGAEINLEDGFIHPEFHDELESRYRKHIDLVAQAGYTNLVCFSGNARGMSKADGLKNAITGLQRILPYAEAKGVVLCLEVFNSKIDHPDYMADSSQWAIDLSKALNSPSFTILYDIYHMQIMEGDIIRTIQDNHQYFGHYHTAGVPGRHEIDDTQELNYPAIMKAILATGFKGIVAQEFIPAAQSVTDKAASLADAIARCDV